MPEEGGQRGAHSLRPGSGTRRVLELVEARLEAGEARLADAARRPLLVDEARLDEDVAAARRRERVAEAGRLCGIEACTPSARHRVHSSARRRGEPDPLPPDVGQVPLVRHRRGVDATR